MGKAKNLKNRIGSYKQLNRHSSKIAQLVHTATKLKFQVLTSELEALLVEAELIRTYQPEFNTLLKDDKSPLYIHITDEEFPKVEQRRKKELKHLLNRGKVIGPLPSGYKVNQVLKIARPMFPWCNQRGSGKADTACFYRHLKLCPGACIGEISAQDYQRNIKHLTQFLRGKSIKLIKQIKQEMKTAAKQEKFETAAQLRNRAEALEAVTRSPYILRPDPQPLLLADKQSAGRLVYLQRLLALNLGLPTAYPLTRIEAYDVSNTSGKNAAVAMVVTIDGEPEPAEYRLFNIRSLDTPNDYQMLKEALLRRQGHPEWGSPNLIIIDGGKGQLRAALSVWQNHCPVISLAKKPDRLIFAHLEPLGKSQSNLKSNNLIPSSTVAKQKIKYDVVNLPAQHPGLQLAQQLRDEAHRFSKKQHQRRRQKAMFF